MSVYNNVDPAEDESHQAVSSYFLGPKAENFEYFKKNILQILEGQRDARLDYFARDGVRFPPRAKWAFRAKLFGVDEESVDPYHRDLLRTMFKRPRSFAILPERSLMQSGRLRVCSGNTVFPSGKLFRIDS